MMKVISFCAVVALVFFAVSGCGKSAPPPAPAPTSEEHSVNVAVSQATEGEPANAAEAAGATGTAQAPSAAAEGEMPAAAPETAGEMPDKVARVGDMVITAQQFAHDLALRAAEVSRQTGQPVDPDSSDFRAAALAEMIDARVLRSLASRAVTVTDDEVNREYERGRRALGSEGKFQDYLKRDGLDEAGLKALLRDRIAIDAYTKQKVAADAVTEDEIKKLYDELDAQGRFERKDRTVDVAHIGVHPAGDQPADAEKARKAVEDARARIAGGESFEQVAMEVSDDKDAARSGGVYEEAGPSKLPPYIAERVFKQTPGELSEPFEGGGAWHLLKVIAVNEPGKVTLEKAHDRLRLMLLEEKRRDAVAKAVDQAKYIMDIEIYKADLRPKQGPGSESAPPAQLGPPARSKENYVAAPPASVPAASPSAQAAPAAPAENVPAAPADAGK